MENPVPTATSFTALGTPEAISAVLAERGITTPTPIQAATLPDSLAGRDVLGRGRTGSGKTFAFLIPLVTRLAASPRPGDRKPRGLVLAPTRELALQIEESLEPLLRPMRLSSTTVFGGVNQRPQVAALRAGVDIVVACPGRLLDLHGQGELPLDGIRITVVDEADQMSDMGFLPMLRRILDATPRDGQRLLFSATLDGQVAKVVERYLHDPVVHEADSALSPVSAMAHHVFRVEPSDRLDVLVDLAAAPGRTIMFTRTKHGAKKLAKQLIQRGVPAVDLHGNLSQNARTRNLDAFHTGRVETLIATDIAARGIHVDEVGLVVHADPPVEHKAYLHRSGRTARAGASGTVVTLATPEQRPDVRSLMRAAGIHPQIHEVTATAPILLELAPGTRALLAPAEAAEISQPGVAAQHERERVAAQKRRATQQKSGQHKPGQPGERSSAGAQNRSHRRRRSAGGRAAR